jgi:hypothetical protein
LIQVASRMAPPTWAIDARRLDLSASAPSNRRANPARHALEGVGQGAELVLRSARPGQVPGAFRSAIRRRSVISQRPARRWCAVAVDPPRRGQTRRVAQVRSPVSDGTHHRDERVPASPSRATRRACSDSGRARLPENPARSRRLGGQARRVADSARRQVHHRRLRTDRREQLLGAPREIAIAGAVHALRHRYPGSPAGCASRRPRSGGAPGRQEHGEHDRDGQDARDRRRANGDGHPLRAPGARPGRGSAPRSGRGATGAVART